MNMFPFHRVRTAVNPEAQIDKVIEELLELRAELNHEYPTAKRIGEEYWDVVQAASTLGYLLQDMLGEKNLSEARQRVITHTAKRGYYTPGWDE